MWVDLVLHSFAPFSVLAENIVLQTTAFSTVSVVYSGQTGSVADGDKCSR